MKHSETDGLSVRAAAIALRNGDCIERIDRDVGDAAERRGEDQDGAERNGCDQSGRYRLRQAGRPVAAGVVARLLQTGEAWRTGPAWGGGRSLILARPRAVKGGPACVASS